jgi:hypothetical protein
MTIKTNWKRWHTAGYTSELLPITIPGVKIAGSRIQQGMLGKTPGVKNADGTWSGYVAWQNVHAEEDDLKRWKSWNAGIGVQGRQFPAVDIDVNDAESANTIMALALETLGPAPVRYRDDSPRPLLMYRAGETLTKRRTAFRDASGQDHAVEFLGKGQYFNVEGLHPKGQIYRWREDGEHKHPCDLTPAGLTQITAEQLDRFIEQVVEYIDLAGGSIIKKSESGTGERAANAGQRVAQQDPWTLYKMEEFINQQELNSATHGVDIDDTAHAVAAKFGDWGAEYETAVEYMVWWSEKCCDVPMKLDRIQEVTGSALRNRLTAVGSKHPSLWDDISEIIMAEYPDGIPPMSKEIAAQHALFEKRVAEIKANAIEGAAKASEKKPKLYYAKYADAVARSGECGDPLIDEILDCETISVVYGDSNTGKSFTELEKDFCIATGRPWAGHKIIKQGAVVYVAAEGGLGIFKRFGALDAMKRHYGLENQDIPLVVVPCPCDLRRPDADVQPLIQLLREVEADAGQKVVKVTLDTLSRIMAGGEENSSVDMGAIVQHADLIREEIKTHVSFIHHTGKDASKGARGHSLLRAATDTEIEVELGKLAVTKQRDLESKDRKFGFKLHKVTVGYRKDGKPITSCCAETTLEQKPVATVSDGLLDVVDKLDAAIASECKNDEAAIKEFTFDAKFVGAALVKLKYQKLTKVQLDN